MQTISMLTTVLFFTTAATGAHAWYVDAAPAEVGAIAVKLADASKGACWTNLNEAKEYAEAKLQLAGFEVNPNGAYMFEVGVTALRAGNSTDAPCAGAVSVQLFAYNAREGVFGLHEIGSNLSVGATSAGGNFNRSVLDLIGSFVEDMQDRSGKE